LAHLTVIERDFFQLFVKPVLNPFIAAPNILKYKIVNNLCDGALASAAAKSLQSCPTLCDPIDRSPPGSHASGILQARTLEWVAISFSSG